VISITETTLFEEKKTYSNYYSSYIVLISGIVVVSLFFYLMFYSLGHKSYSSLKGAIVTSLLFFYLLIGISVIWVAYVSIRSFKLFKLTDQNIYLYVDFTDYKKDRRVPLSSIKELYALIKIKDSTETGLLVNIGPRKYFLLTKRRFKDDYYRLKSILNEVTKCPVQTKTDDEYRNEMLG